MSIVRLLCVIKREESCGITTTNSVNYNGIRNVTMAEGKYYGWVKRSAYTGQCAITIYDLEQHNATSCPSGYSRLNTSKWCYLREGGW